MRQTFRIPLTNGYTLHATEEVIHPQSSETTVPSSLNHKEEDKNTSFVLIVVHGGPGINSSQEILDCMSSSLMLTEEEEDEAHSNATSSSSRNPKIPKNLIKAIVFYDQLGCGKSDAPEFNAFEDIYSLKYYVRELAEVIHFIQNRHCHQEGSKNNNKNDNNNTNVYSKICLLGYSWGGQIVLEYLLDPAQTSSDNCVDTIQCKCAIISNSPLNERTYENRQQEIRNTMDVELRSFIEQEEQQQIQLSSNEKLIGTKIYQKLIGFSDANITGEMTHWDALKRLPNLPPCLTLFVTGHNDTVPYQEYISLDSLNYKHIPPKVLILENGDHAPFYGETRHIYFDAITNFLRQQLK